MNFCIKVSAKLRSLLKSDQMRYNYVRCYKYDVAIIGGGIIGTAIAKTTKEIMREAKIALIEKEDKLGQHQSSNNSQVIHAGIYYKPNSLKAKLCVQGSNLIYDYCDCKNIPVKRYGKLIIGTNALDTYRLEVLYKQGLENRISGLELLDNWKDIQPQCTGLKALWSPNSGNIDWEVVTKSFGDDFQNEGGDTYLSCDVTCIKESTEPSHPLMITTATDNKFWLAKYVIICIGLHSGTLFDADRNKCFRNISLNVNYHLLSPKLNRFIRTNIYAMPHLDMPFIGIHISPTVEGKVLLGPNAVPSLQLDGYNKHNAVDVHYLQKHVISKNFGLLFLKNFQSCLKQVTESFFIDVQTSILNTYFPMLSKHDILPGPTAVQGQIVTNDGEFVDDFVINIFEGNGIQKRIVNCRFIPSPGATSSLAVGRMISEELIKLPI